jgi:DNA mismatch repair protein MutS2
MVQLNSPELQSNEINVVGCTVDEAIHRVDKFLDSAFLASVSQVRLIHGTGMGVLRKALSEWLSQQPYVEKFFAADANQGGNGVTIVSLKAE